MNTIETVLQWSFGLSFIGIFIVNEVQLTEYGQDEKPLTKIAFKILLIPMTLMVISCILFFTLK